METDWKAVSDFFNGVIEESDADVKNELGTHLELHIYSPCYNETMKVVVPTDRVKDFMHRLGLWEAEVYSGRPKKERD